MFNLIILYMYNGLFVLFLPIAVIRLLIKSINHKNYRSRILERLGVVKLPKHHDLTHKIWIHAVSVGEIMATIPIIQQIKQHLPKSNILLTCTTPRGSEIIQQKLANLVDHVYLPFDVSFAIKNLLHQFQPKIVIIMEKEIWPNLIFYCNKQQIPIILANAQLTVHSLKKYCLIKPLFNWLLSKVKYICVQTAIDAARFKQIIAPEAHEQILICGNTKFDVINNVSKHRSIEQSPQPIWIAASTHELEEPLIIEAHQQILTKIPNCLLILAPRHPERADQITQKLSKQNLLCTRSSEQPIFDNNTPIKVPIYLIDVIGQLNNLYAISQAAFVGGSLTPNIGGHNVLEPASLGLAIAVGPYTNNCQETINELLSHNGIVVINNSEELATVIYNWLLDPKLSNTIGENAKNYLKQKTGATNKIIQLILELTSKA